MRWYRIIPVAVLLAACGGGDGFATIGTSNVSTTSPSTASSTASSTVESTVPFEPPTSSTESTATSAPSSSEAPASGAGSEGQGVPAILLEPILIDAATRSGVEVGEVTVVSAELRDWPDGALGCPAPGMLYTQVITPGYRIVVEAGGGRLDYRMNRKGAFRLCESGGAIPDVRTPSTTIPGTSSSDT